MERLQAGGGLDAVAAVYRRQAVDAVLLTDRKLRWTYDRCRHQGTDVEVKARLRALGDELRRRGLETPA